MQRSHLAAGRLEKVVSLWIEEITKEEHCVLSEEKLSRGARYSGHANV